MVAKNNKSSSEALRIVIVDSDEVMRKAIRTHLEAIPEVKIAGEAAACLAAARARRPSVPKAALSMLMTARLADGHLRRLTRAGYDPFHPLVSRRSPRQSWGLAWAALRGRY